MFALLFSELHWSFDILELVTPHRNVRTLWEAYASAKVFEGAVYDLSATHDWL